MTKGACESATDSAGQSTNCAKLNRKTAFTCASEAFAACAPSRAAHTSNKVAVIFKNAMRLPHTPHAGCPDDWDWSLPQTPGADRAGDSARRARDRGATSAAR